MFFFFRSPHPIGRNVKGADFIRRSVIYYDIRKFVTGSTQSYAWVSTWTYYRWSKWLPNIDKVHSVFFPMSKWQTSNSQIQTAIQSLSPEAINFNLIPLLQMYSFLWLIQINFSLLNVLSMLQIVQVLRDCLWNYTRDHVPSPTMFPCDRNGKCVLFDLQIHF